MHPSDPTTDFSSAGLSLNTLTGPAGVLIQDKVDIILSTHLKETDKMNRGRGALKPMVYKEKKKGALTKYG